MPISYALLLCVPIGLLFFWIGRLCSLYVLGRYERTERRASMAFGVFGALLIPDIWIIGNLLEEFPGTSGMLMAYLLLVGEGLVLIAIFRPFPRRGSDMPGPTERVKG